MHRQDYGKIIGLGELLWKSCFGWFPGCKATLYLQNSADERRIARKTKEDAILLNTR